MRIYVQEDKAKGIAKRLRRVLRALGVETSYARCLNLAAQLLGYDHWAHFRARDPDAILSPFDEQLSDAEFLARDDFQMNVLATAGLTPIARELLDRANPTGSWARQTSEILHDRATSAT
jgi:hypothetical protein